VLSTSRLVDCQPRSMAMGMDRMVVWTNGENENLNVTLTWGLIVALTSKTHLDS
jgi:hypothetical protein